MGSTANLRHTEAPERMLKPAEAGEILRIHPKTVINKAEAGKIPGIKIGNRWRFSPSVLYAWQRGEIQ